MNLLALRCFDDLFALEHVTLGLSDCHRLPFLINLRNAAEPRVVKSDSTVVLTDDCAIDAGGITCETDVIGCAVQLPAGDDDVRTLLAFIALIPCERTPFGAHVWPVSQFPQGFDEESLLRYVGFQFQVFAQMASLRSQGLGRRRERSRDKSGMVLFRIAEGSPPSGYDRLTSLRG